MWKPFKYFSFCMFVIGVRHPRYSGQALTSTIFVEESWIGGPRYSGQAFCEYIFLWFFPFPFLHCTRKEVNTPVLSTFCTCQISPTKAFILFIPNTLSRNLSKANHYKIQNFSLLFFVVFDTLHVMCTSRTFGLTKKDFCGHLIHFSQIALVHFSSSAHIRLSQKQSSFPCSMYNFFHSLYSNLKKP